MKNNRFLQSLICLLAVSCSVNELDMQVPDRSEKPVFHAILESSEPDTKVYLDEHIKILWDEDDRISIFDKSTLNQQFRFAGEPGENSGDFFWVEDDYFGAGNNLGYICAVYPYRKSTSISNANVLTLTLPEEQTYREKSFGPGANTMVSVTNDHLLRFKNVGGYLAFRFYGGSSEEPVTVSSIRLVGNNGETLSGEATMTPVVGQVPGIRWASTTGKSILLDCGETGVNLGTTREEATVFWMVVPPTYFSSGFTLLVTDTNGDVFIKKTTKDLTVDRNAVLRVSPVQVDMNSTGPSLNNVSSADPDKLPSTTAIDNRTFTVTMPTLDRSHLVLNYDCTEGASLMANGQAFEPGDPIDVTKPVTLTVYNGNYGKNYTIVGKNTGLPIVRITTNVLTNGSTGFSVTDLDAYQNRLQNIETYSYPRDTTKWVDERVWLPEADGVFVTVRIEDFDGSPGMKTTAGVPLYKTDSQIKGRGNYSWKWEKKPYALKFDSKREVLGMPAHKRWVLLANWRDRTLLRNDATFWLAKKAHDELPYTTRGQFVELEINGEYRGNYYLCEQIKIDENRVNITELKDNPADMSGGFLMEIDSYWDEANKFKSQYFDLRYMFKEPDEDRNTILNTDPDAPSDYGTAYSTMKNYINAFEKIVKTKSAVVDGDGLGLYANYLDVDSAIMFMLLNELVGNGDFFQTSTDEVFGPHSTYLYKDKGNSPLFMGPVWDFDYLTFTPKPTYGNFSWKGFNNNKYYYYFLCADQQFVDRIQYLWSLYKTDFAKLPDYITSMKTKLTESQKFDEARWPYDSQYDNTTQKNRNDNKDYSLSYEAAITRMKDSFVSRYNWLDGKISSLITTNPSGPYSNGNGVAGVWLFP